MTQFKGTWRLSAVTNGWSNKSGDRWCDSYWEWDSRQGKNCSAGRIFEEVDVDILNLSNKFRTLARIVQCFIPYVWRSEQSGGSAATDHAGKHVISRVQTKESSLAHVTIDKEQVFEDEGSESAFYYIYRPVRSLQLFP